MKCVTQYSGGKLQSDGKLESLSVSHQEFTGLKGDRYKLKRPQDSNVLRADGSFTAITDKNSEYTPKSGDRYDTVRPGTSEIWKV